jgi:hypothetical protein
VSVTGCEWKIALGRKRRWGKVRWVSRELLSHLSEEARLRIQKTKLSSLPLVELHRGDKDVQTRFMHSIHLLHPPPVPSLLSAISASSLNIP